MANKGKENDIFAPATKIVPDVNSIEELLSERAKHYFNEPDLLDPYMGKELKVGAQGKKKKKSEPVYTPPQQAVLDYCGRWEMRAMASEDVLIYFVKLMPDQPELELRFFMLNREFKIVHPKEAT